MPGKKRTLRGIYNTLQEIKKNEGIDINVGTYEDFYNKYKSVNQLPVLFDQLNTMFANENIQINLPSKEEFCSSFATHPVAKAQPVKTQPVKTQPVKTQQGTAKSFVPGVSAVPDQSSGNAVSSPINTFGISQQPYQQAQYGIDYTPSTEMEVKPFDGSGSRSTREVVRDARQANRDAIARLRAGMDLGKLSEGDRAAIEESRKAEDEYLSAMESRQEGEFFRKQDTRENLGDLESRINTALDKAAKAEREHTVKSTSTPMGRFAQGLQSAESSSTFGGVLADKSSREGTELREAQRQIRDAKRIINEADIAAEAGRKEFTGGAIRGTARLFDIDNWLSSSDLSGNLSLKDALNTLEHHPDQLTESQQMLIDAVVTNMAVNAYFGSDVSVGYKAGQITAGSIPFMVEMVMNPASGIGKALQKYAAKKLANAGMGKVAKKVTEKAVRVAGDLAGAATMTATTGSVRTAADAVDRTNGQVRYDLDSEGNFVYKGREGMLSAGEALYKAIASSTIENQSEMIGEYFGPIIKALGKAGGKISASRLGQTLGIDAARNMLDRVGSSGFAKTISELERKAQWHGIFGEFSEEMIGGTINGLVVGDQTLDRDPETGVFNAQNMLETLAGLSLISGSAAALKTGGYFTTRRNLHNAEVNARELFDKNGQWDAIRESITNTNSLTEAISGLMIANPNATQEQKRALLEYVKAYMEYTGAEEMTRRMAEADPIEVARVNGYEIDESVNPNARMDAYTAMQVYPEGSDEYKRAEAMVAGIIKRIEDDKLLSVIDAQHTVERMLAEDGMLRPVTNRQGEVEYVCRGNLIALDDGTIDKEHSDKSVVVFNPNTSKYATIDPSDQVDGIDEVQQPVTQEDVMTEFEDMAEANAQAQRDAYAGKIDLQVGQEIGLGNGTTATVTAIDGDNVSLAYSDGHTEVISADGVQQMADQVRINAFRTLYNVPDDIQHTPVDTEDGGEDTGAGADEEGFVEGVPSVITPGMVLEVDDDGEAKRAEVMRRVRLEGGEFVDDPNGNVIEMSVDGEIVHASTSWIGENTLAYKDVEVEDGPEQGAEETEEQRIAREKAEAEERIAEEERLREQTPEGLYDTLKADPDLDAEEVTAYISSNLTEVEKKVADIEKKKPTISTDLAKYKAVKAAWQQELDAATAELERWNAMKALDDAYYMEVERAAEDEVKRARAEEQAREDAKLKTAEEAKAEAERKEAEKHAAAVEAEKKRQDEIKRKRAEQMQRGANAVHPAIREKWDAATKVEGGENEITLANGEKIEGHYVLVESGAATPSHNPNAEFARNDGFPVDKNGQTINDRDYERDKDAQRITRDMGMRYDSRALSDVPVVSADGVVISGNGRTMAGEIAAQYNTDGAYIDNLSRYAYRFGFAKEQVEGMQHPRVVFVPNNAMPYTTETFAKFNKEDKKSQSRTERSVKMGKVVDDNTFGRIVRSINSFDSLSEFYTDKKAARDAIMQLNEVGAIDEMQMAEMLEGDGVSVIGRQRLEDVLVGKAFEGNPDAVRMLEQFPAMRQSVVSALFDIVNNRHFGEEYSLANELANAIKLVYSALHSGYKHGELVSGYAKQTNLFVFDEGETVADYTNATVMMLADLMNSGKTNNLKKSLAMYNARANDAANGQVDLFGGGQLENKEDIIKDVLNTLHYGSKQEIEQRIAKSEAKRKRAAERDRVQQDGNAGSSNQEGQGAGEQREEVATKNGQSNKPAKETAGIAKGAEYAGCHFTYLKGRASGVVKSVEDGNVELELTGISGRVTTETIPVDEFEKRLEGKYQIVDENATEAASEEESSDGGTQEKDTGEDGVSVDEKEKDEAETPVTEEQIRNSDLDDTIKTLAIGYLNGGRTIQNQLAFKKAQQYVRNQSGNLQQDSRGENGTLVGEAAAGNQRPAESGRSIPSDESVDRGTGTEEVPGVEERGQNSTDDVPASTGVRRNSGVSGGTSSERAGAGDSSRSSVRGVNGHSVRSGKGGEAGRRNAAADGGRNTEAGPKGNNPLEDAKAGFDAGLDDFKKALDRFKNGGKGKLSVSLTGLNEDQVEALMDMTAATMKMGYNLLKAGVYKIEEWTKHMKDAIGDILKDVAKWNDTEIDDFIRDAWDSPYDIDGETKLMREWAAQYGDAELRKIISADLNEKLKQQQEADRINDVKLGDIEDIRRHLPYLLPDQQEDVRKAEVQMFDESHADREHAYGKGYLFTNGTGTGKTYTGLGIAKRFTKQGKGRILIVTPSQEKVGDWIKDASNLGIQLKNLDDKNSGKSATQNKGEGAVVTTFANFRQNRALLEDVFDLVIYDESQYIIENKGGAGTACYNQHVMVTNRDEEAALKRLQTIHPLWIEEEELQKENNALDGEIAELNDKGVAKFMEDMKSDVPTLRQYAANLGYNYDYLDSAQKEGIMSRMFADRINKAATKIASNKNRIDELHKLQNEVIPELREKGKLAVPVTKTVFLSATPFNTVANLRYGAGYIFSYPEEDATTIGSYNHRSPEYAFFEQWFPSMFRWRQGRLESSVTDQDAVAREEIYFSDYLQEKINTMSGRSIDNGYDYSRDFPMVSVLKAGDWAKEEGDNNPQGPDGGVRFRDGDEVGIDDGSVYFDEDEISNGDVMYRSGEGRSYSENRLGVDVESVVEGVSSKLNTGVKVINSLNDPTMEGMDQSAKGWFDVRTGEVVLVLPNCENEEDVVQTLLHEIVGHKGLRELVGAEKFDSFMDDVYAHLSTDLRDQVDRAALRQFVDGLYDGNGRTYEECRREAVDEIMAEAAENMNEGKFAEAWAYIKHAVQAIFDKLLSAFHIPHSFTIGPNEVRYMLWRSRNNLVRGSESAIGLAQDMVKREDFGLDDNAYDVRYRRRTLEDSTSRAMARHTYEQMMADAKTQFSEAMQDSMMSLEKLYESVLGRGMRIEDVKDGENAYLAENRMPSMNAAQTNAWHHDYMEPLIKAVYNITHGDQEEYTELTDYMMAKHGLERNEVLARRDARREAEKKYGDQIDEARADVDNNPGDNVFQEELDNLLQAMHDYEEEKYSEYRGKDYSGLTALAGVSDIAKAENVARAMVEDYENKHDVQELWDACGRATRSSLEKCYACGLMSLDRYNEIRGMFQYYIPLQGFAETVAEDEYAYMGSDGTLGYGTPIRTAKGRKSMADDPLATIRMNGEAAIRQGNRNLMKQRFLNFVQAHPSDLVSVQDVWLHKDEFGDWVQFFDADLRPEDSPADIERKMEEFEERMEALAKKYPGEYVKSREMPNIPFRVVKKQDSNQHVVMVKRGGENYLLVINGNPRAAQALNGLTNPNVQTEGAFGKVKNLGERINRWLAPIYTTLNPEFMISNFIRDAVYSNSMTWVKEGGEYARRFSRNFVKYNPVHMMRLYKMWESGELARRAAALSYNGGNMSNQDKELVMFYDFMMNGGETGWTNLRAIEKHKKELEKAIKLETNPTKRALKAIGGAYDMMNRSVENCARFTAFVTSRESGRSVGRSVWDAKEVSVNFNKKGAGDKFLEAKGETKVGKVASFISGFGRGSYLFWNASLQGLTNIMGGAKKNPKKAAALFGTLAAMGSIQPILSAIIGGDDDDEYYNLPEYKRRSCICFRWSKDMPWVTIPLPIEYRAIYGLGELSTGVALGKEHYTDEEMAIQFVSQISQVLPIDFMEGGGGLHAFIPSQVKPIVEVLKNRGWSGLPIHRDDTFREYDPQWTLAYSNTNDVLLGGTKWLNEVTGGSDVTTGFIDLNPADIEYLANSYLGGPFTMVNKMQKMFGTIAGTREFDVRNIPIASRVIYQGDESTEMRKVKNRYFNLGEEYEKTKHDIIKLTEEKDGGRDDAYVYEERLDWIKKSKEYNHYKVMSAYTSLTDKILDIEKEASEEEAKVLKAYRENLMDECVTMVNEVDEGLVKDVDDAIISAVESVAFDRSAPEEVQERAKRVLVKKAMEMADEVGDSALISEYNRYMDMLENAEGEQRKTLTLYKSKAKALAKKYAGSKDGFDSASYRREVEEMKRDMVASMKKIE